MKASLVIMSQLAGEGNFPTDAKEITLRVGAQIGAIEEVLELGPLYQDALIVKVVSAEPIAGSDHLNLCWIDDQQVRESVERSPEGLVQVVCGAPNVKAGQIAVWLPPGSVVPSSASSAEPFKLSSRKIMDFISNGMLASASELAISSDHNGIVVLPDDTNHGTKLIDLIRLDDVVMDIENKMFTHRPDLFGQLGIAREICAVFGQPFKSPEWYREDHYLVSPATGSLSVDNQLVNGACPRFMAVAIDKLKIGPSPLWLQSYLSRSGIRPLNNVVDITNYVMLVSGQPLHAYDLDKIGSDGKAELIVRDPLPNEKLKLIDGSAIDLVPKDIVIANRERAIGLGGVMGGYDSEIGSETTKIVLESASFDMYRIRHSSMAHGIFSEAVTRFNKGPSPRQCPAILSYAFSLLKQLCPEAELISEVVDAKDEALLNNRQAEVSLEFQQLTSYLGVELNPKEVISLLANAELEASFDGQSLHLIPPFWRTDLSIGVDLIEEIARLYGYDRLPKKLPSRPLDPPEWSNLQNCKRQLRRALSAAGANEVLSYSFINSALLEAASQEKEQAYKLMNALSPELEYYRISLLPSLLSKVHPNHKAGFDRFGLYELGKAHLVGQVDADSLPIEAERLALVVSADSKSAKQNYQGEAYYQARVYLDYLLGALGFDSDKLEFTPLDDSSLDETDKLWLAAAKTYRPGRSAVVRVSGKTLGLIGELSTKVTQALKLPAFCAGFELDIEALSQLSPLAERKYHQQSRFPKAVQDLTLPSAGKNYADLASMLKQSLVSLLPKDVSFELTAIDAYQPKDDLNNTNWTFRLQAESASRTLTDKEISEVLTKLTDNLKSS